MIILERIFEDVCKSKLGDNFLEDFKKDNVVLYGCIISSMGIVLAKQHKMHMQIPLYTQKKELRKVVINNKN